VLVAITLVDFVLGSIAGIPNLLLREVLVPLLLMAFLVRHAREARDLFLGVAKNPVMRLLCGLILLLVVNFVRHPVLPANVLGVAAEQSGFRYYFSSFSGLAAAFLAYWSVLRGEGTIRWIRRMVFAVSGFFLGLGFASWVVGQPIALPFLPSASQTWVGVNVTYLYSGVSLRIGYLQMFGPMMAAASLVATPSTLGTRVVRYLGIGLGIGATFLSGGRASFLGLVLLVVAYELLLAKDQARFDIPVLVSVGMLGVFVSLELFPGQLQRMSGMLAGLEGIDPSRALLFRLYLEGFLQSPIMGQGIGSSLVKAFSIDPAWGAFVNQQLQAGGHSAYLSILYLYGVAGGFLWFGLFIGSLFGGAKAARAHVLDRSPVGFISRFGFLSLVSTIPVYVVGGNGVGDPWFFIVVGCLAAIGHKPYVSASLARGSAHASAPRGHSSADAALEPAVGRLGARAPSNQ